MRQKSNGLFHILWFLPPANEVAEGDVFTPVCHSVHREMSASRFGGVPASRFLGCLPLGPGVNNPWGIHPWTHTPPWADTPLNTPPADTPWTHTPYASTPSPRLDTPWTHPLGRHPLGRHNPSENIPRADIPRVEMIIEVVGAPYWNAFLSLNIV